MSTPTADLLFELGTEELPAGPLMTMAEALQQGIGDGLTQNGLTFGTSRLFATPRRLAVLVEGLALEAPDKTVEHLGPPVAASRDASGNWTAAAQGFARKQGVDIDALTVISTPKGERLGIRRTEPGAQAAQVLPDILEAAVAKVPVSKRMRWGRAQHEFLRPVQWIVALFGDEVVPMSVMGVDSNRATRGHRFHHPDRLELATATEYESKLREAHVVADFLVRRESIETQVNAVAEQVGARAVIDPALLDEVTGLVEWPVALMGTFDSAFLEVPAGAVISSMKEHQKYFHLVDADDQLLPRFITIANIESRCPDTIIEGNEKVIRPRLSDAAFFFESDKTTPLADRAERLEGIVFQQKLGTVADKTRRIVALSGWLAQQLGADPAISQRAALLAKCDLVSDLVLEFPDLQGIAGAYYARHDGEPDGVAAAVEQHYWPRFAGDELPDSPEAAAVALADRIDTLTGIFGIGQPPSGSKDPFALRRASLAVIRILMGLGTELDLTQLTQQAVKGFDAGVLADSTAQDVTDYTMDRFRAWYEDQGVPVGVLRAVIATGVTCPAEVNGRVEALQAFAGTDAATALAAANKRVANILNKSEQAASGKPNPDLFQEHAEKALFESLQGIEADVTTAISTKAYGEALARLATLQEPVDLFFDEVMVNAEETSVRNNRHELLAALRNAFTGIADFALLGGGAN